MKRFEYKRVEFDIEDPSGLNQHGDQGWHVVAIFAKGEQGVMGPKIITIALMERELGQDPPGLLQ